MKSLLLGIAFVVFLGVGGFVYRNAVEHPTRPVACPLDALVCPDGTSVSRTGNSCTFSACPPPNISFPDIGIIFALPEGFESVALPGSVAAYRRPGPTSLEPSEIVIRQFPVATSSTPLATIQETAIGGASGLPVSATSYSSTMLGTHRFTVVSIERFEGVVDTAYYLARGADVLRFDAIDRGVMNWSDADLNPSTLQAHEALRELLSTLQGE